MKKTGKILSLIAVATVVAFFAVIGRADVGEPGSSSDPLVTKSYVDMMFGKIQQYLDSERGSSAELKVVSLSPGQQLVGDMGTEIILRSGKAVVLDGAGGGLSDVTDGKDLKKDEVVPANHLLIVPRDDGRGIVAQTNVVVMVRGDFTVGR
ncbi:MAG: hypothetical protein DIU66_002505 [Bacillota bacterium]|nr:MAG: hypothetical protein DIU66_05830 [Bacillota bacterium]